MASRVVPTGVELELSPDVVLFTKSDLRGRITYADEEFQRVTGYTAKELQGRPHSIVRHPDMPRGMFAHLWDVLRSGRESTMIVCNLAADGSHFWVVEQIMPTRDLYGEVLGYNSMRRRVDRRAIEAVKPFYSRMLAAERNIDSSIEAGIAGMRFMDEWLSTFGQNHSEFVWTLLNATPPEPEDRTRRNVFGEPIAPGADLLLEEFRRAGAL